MPVVFLSFRVRTNMIFGKINDVEAQKRNRGPWTKQEFASSNTTRSTFAFDE
jgi:hypothetical protein